MKRQNLRIIGTLLVAILIFSLSCQKSPNPIINHAHKIVLKTDTNLNPNNPYDSAIFYYHIEAMVYVNNTQDTVECEDFDDYWDNFEDYYSNDPLDIITYDTSDIDDIIIDSVSSFVDILCDTNLSLNNFMNKAVAWENRIVNDTNLTTTQKNLILYSSAGFKQIRYIFETETFDVTVDGESYTLDAPGQSWEDLLNDCIRARLAQIFSNPVSIIVFFLPPGPSVNFWIIVAECTWLASQQYWNW